MELFLLGLLLIAAAIVGLVILGRRKTRAAERRNEQTVAEMDEPQDPFQQTHVVDPRQLKMGDLFEYLGVSSAVRGTVRYDENSFEWVEHYLETGRGVATWLTVEEDPDLQCVLWTEVRESGVTPGNKHVTFNGVVYELDERGSAPFTSVGTTGLPPSGNSDYLDYVGPDGQLLSFERYNHGKWEASTGEVVNLNMVSIYPR